MSAKSAPVHAIGIMFAVSGFGYIERRDSMQRRCIKSDKQEGNPAFDVATLGSGELWR